MSLPELAPSDFPAFFTAVDRWSRTGHWSPTDSDREPFPWQVRLVREIAECGRWPDLLDLPTGSGKTAAIDAAVFYLALEADKGEARRAAMRIAFVVDRRLVVDDAYLRARRLEAALAAALEHEGAPREVRVVAERLAWLAGPGQQPLVAARLRGGVPREGDWARTPCQPTVLCSTVDQVGSRLLFRGYGISDRMKPIQAGLLGSDALILLDEAHLSEPFRQTARAIATVPTLRGPDRAPFQAALLTATPGKGEALDLWCFRLGEDDRATLVLAKRLEAPKPVVLKEVGTSEKDRAAALAREALALLRELKDRSAAAPVIGVVANRVARARAAFEQIRRDLGEVGRAVLVIGRSRPVDRDRIAKDLDPIKTGSKARPDKPLIVVATQTIEAGVDIDLDALVTDAAALDALRQRFGRVNRAGREIQARGVILADKTDRKPKKEGDPIYGTAIAETLKALFPTGGETVDFGVQKLNLLLKEAGFVGGRVESLLAEKPDAPVLMPAYMDLWTHTSPIPAADPEIALFLHGPKREPASVQVVWRADLDLDLPNEQLREVLSLAPPRATEALDLPLSAARRWLSGARPDLADVDEAATEDGAAGTARPVFRWRGKDDERSRIIFPKNIRPGDVIVVPSFYGGCDEFGWNPDNTLWTDDVFEEASAPFWRTRYVVRVSPGLIEQAFASQARRSGMEKWNAEALESARERARPLIQKLTEALAGVSESRRVQDALDALDEVPLPTSLGVALNRLWRARRGSIRVSYLKRAPGEVVSVVIVAERGLRILARKRSTAELLRRASTRPNLLLPRAAGADRSVVTTEDDEAASFVGRKMSLRRHCAEVATLSRRYARTLGMPSEWTHDLALAGWLHDAGKADRRFQLYLADGDPFAMEEGDDVLAKSTQGRSRRGARERAGLPERWRHEALSVRLALENPRLREAHDRALVLWLIGTHHGWGRPFFPHLDPLDDRDRTLPEVEGLVGSKLKAGAGPQRLGFVLEGDGFGPTERDANDLRGLDWATMFRELKSRYGPWGLARIEAVLRLADHRASAAASEAGDDT